MQTAASSAAVTSIASPPTTPDATDPTSNSSASPPNITTSATPAATPAVTVTLSDAATQALAAGTSAAPAANTANTNHVQIPPAVLANMQAFSTNAPTAYTDQINQYTSTINNSKASEDDRLNAWTSLSQMLTSGKIYYAGNVADLQTALDATQTSEYAKGLMTLQHQFVATENTNLSAAQANGKWGAQAMVNSYNSFSETDQKKIFVLMGQNLNYADVETMKADYQNVANIYASTGQITNATMQLTSKSGSRVNSQTQTAVSGAQAAASNGESIPTVTSSTTTSDVALTLLQNSAAYAAKVAADQKGSDADPKAGAVISNLTDQTNQTSQFYKQGSVLSLVA